MPDFVMPDGFTVNVPDELLETAHAARLPSGAKLLLGPGTTHYNYHNVSRPGFTVHIVNVRAILTTFRERKAVYKTANLIRVLSAIYGGTDLPPVAVHRTGDASRPYSLQDGFHRFIGTIVAGFTDIPCYVPDAIIHVQPREPLYPRPSGTFVNDKDTEEERRLKRAKRFG